MPDVLSLVPGKPIVVIDEAEKDQGQANESESEIDSWMYWPEERRGEQEPAPARALLGRLLAKCLELEEGVAREGLGRWLEQREVA
jgi:hypothetical protein